MKDKEFQQKIAQDALDTSCDFVAGFFIVFLLCIPFILLSL